MGRSAGAALPLDSCCFITESDIFKAFVRMHDATASAGVSADPA